MGLKTIRVDLSNEIIPLNGYEFIQWFADEINKVPLECRSSIEIVIDRESESYNGPCIELRYEREETNEEALKRCEIEQRREDIATKRDRRDYERLKLKFDN